MAEKKSRRVYAGYYNRYDGKLIYVARVVTDIDTGEETVICQYANYSDTGEYHTITKKSFCEQVEWNRKMINKYSRRTQQKIDRMRLLIQEENSMPEPKRRTPKDRSDEYDNRGYRRSKTYYDYVDGNQRVCERCLVVHKKPCPHCNHQMEPRFDNSHDPIFWQHCPSCGFIYDMRGHEASLD